MTYQELLKYGESALMEERIPDLLCRCMAFIPVRFQDEPIGLSDAFIWACRCRQRGTVSGADQEASDPLSASVHYP